jgi:hypothetical protein
MSEKGGRRKGSRFLWVWVISKEMEKSPIIEEFNLLLTS